MGVTSITIHRLTCDHCGQESELADCGQGYVDAMTYGTAFHVGCWEEIGGPRVARVLGLDEIVFKGGPNDGERAWGPRC